MTRNQSDTGMMIIDLIEKLASQDPVTRETSREKLVEIGGHEVIRALVDELTDPREHVRWEAAKALTAIADPLAAPALLHALEDENEDVRWVAAEALIALGETGLRTVLSGLTRRARSVEFCRSAHHVLHDLKSGGDAAIVDPVLRALESSEPQVGAPPAAFKALLAMKDLAE